MLAALGVGMATSLDAVRSWSAPDLVVEPGGGAAGDARVGWKRAVARSRGTLVAD